jgi:hypothetical protein
MKLTKSITQVMLLRLLLMTGQYQHEQNWCMMAGSGLKSKQWNRLHVQAHKLPCMQQHFNDKC